MGKIPSELAGLEDGQIDWMYYAIVDKYEREAALLNKTESSVVFNSSDK